MKRKDAQALGDILKDLLKEQKLDKKLNEVRLMEAWETVVGKNIAAYTNQKYIKNSILFVHLSSSVLRSELMMSRQILVNSLNKAVGESVITDIVFR